jgi:hypothetical protein
LTEYPGGWYAVDERSPEPHRGEHEADMPERARELAEAGAAYAEVEEEGERPNPAVHGDAQDGTASRVGGDTDLAASDQAERFGAESGGGPDAEAAARDTNATEERED